mmetsp:Transcript_25510/g.36596  ORF Transcript_25510/g.36596 Transcript_25510/m.36596 type:complete len:145 (+) Transcript_25510:703-1137(+)
MGHYSAMAGVFFRFNIHVLGHVETFKSDWENIIKPLYNITKEFNENLGMHKTSMHHPKNIAEKVPPDEKDPNNARKSLLQFLEEDVRYKQAICHLILIDYVCLPMYALPLECQHLNATRDAAIEAVTHGLPVPHKVVHTNTTRN